MKCLKKSKSHAVCCITAWSNPEEEDGAMHQPQSLFGFLILNAWDGLG